MSDTRKGWERYCKYLCACPDAGVTLDISRMKFDDGLFAQADAALQAVQFLVAPADRCAGRANRSSMPRRAPMSLATTWAEAASSSAPVALS